MFILGIDPGSRVAGYGLIEVQKKKVSYLYSGTLRFNCSTDFFSRLIEIHQQLHAIQEKWDVKEIAFESLIYTKNVSSLIKLSQARAAMITAFSKVEGVGFFEYAPNQIKSAISGFGHSDKLGVQKALNLMLNKKLELNSSDEGDALAIACCHALMRDGNSGKMKLNYLGNRGRSLQNSVNLKKLRSRL